MENFFNILLFSLAAMFGTFARFGLSHAIQKILGPNFPWGIFIVNILGCFGFGLILASTENTISLEPSTRISLLLGFMGAFTTFSTFIFDCDSLIKEKKWSSLVANILGQIILGVMAFVLAIKLVEFCI